MAYRRPIEDVFMCKVLASIELTLRSDSEFLCISIDATLKVAMSIKGQASYRSSASVRNQACFGDDEALRRVLTVRGRTGAVLAMQLIKGEDAPEVAFALQSALSEMARAQVRYVMSDSPSLKLLQALKAVFPNLSGLALDPVHLAIVYEYAQWRKRTPGSKLLRELLHKVVQHDAEKGMLSALALGIQEWLCFPPPCEGVQAIPGQCLFRGKHRCRSRVYIRITCVIFYQKPF